MEENRLPISPSQEMRSLADQAFPYTWVASNQQLIAQASYEALGRKKYYDDQAWLQSQAELHHKDTCYSYGSRVMMDCGSVLGFQDVNRTGPWSGGFYQGFGSLPIGTMCSRVVDQIYLRYLIRIMDVVKNVKLIKQTMIEQLESLMNEINDDDNEAFRSSEAKQLLITTVNNELGKLVEDYPIVREHRVVGEGLFGKKSDVDDLYKRYKDTVDKIYLSHIDSNPGVSDERLLMIKEKLYQEPGLRKNTLKLHSLISYINGKISPKFYTRSLQRIMSDLGEVPNREILNSLSDLRNEVEERSLNMDDPSSYDINQLLLRQIDDAILKVEKGKIYIASGCY